MNEASASKLRQAWQLRAVECRTAAKRLRSFDARQRMLAAANNFDQMAIRVTYGDSQGPLAFSSPDARPL
jgi:hypothetical protein